MSVHINYHPEKLPRMEADASTFLIWQVHIADWYATYCALAGAPIADDPIIAGAPRPIDGVDVWPLLTGSNLSQPRPLTVITEVSAIEVSADPDGLDAGRPRLWKLLTLAGQSNYYEEDGKQKPGPEPCLAGFQPDPPQPGRTDPIVNNLDEGGKTVHSCAVCNATRPCLYVGHFVNTRRGCLVTAGAVSTRTTDAFSMRTAGAFSP